MKNVICVLMILLSFKMSFGQLTYGDLNGYKYIIINEVTGCHPKSTRNYFYNSLRKCGFCVLKEGEVPQDLKNNPSLALYCNVTMNKSWNGFNTSVVLINTNREILYKNNGASGGLMSHAVRRAIKPLSKVVYSYDPDKRLVKPELIIKTDETEESLREYFDNNHISTIEGIYKTHGDSNNFYKFGIKKDDNKYVAIIIESKSDFWKPGEVKAIFEPTAISGYYSTKYYMGNKSEIETFSTLKDKCILTMKLPDLRGVKLNTSFIKVYPQDIVSANEGSVPGKIIEFSGTGFFMDRNGIIATNAHVVENAKKILVQIKIGSEFFDMESKILLKDDVNDVALLKITDDKFKNIESLPYAFVKKAAAGEICWTIGYPLNNVMGENFKVSEGIISSISGIKDDYRYYQISVPLQPGNSGGPLFDENGNIIGITSAKLNSKAIGTNIENVNYAIKISYLLNLYNMIPNSNQLDTTPNKISGNLKDKVRTLKSYVCLIKVKCKQ